MENKFYSLWLALICILVFILQLAIPGFTQLFLLNQKAFPQFWRFVTAIFLHGSLLHIVYNLFALVFFGLILEKFIGSKKFLVVFFFSGILANIISVNFYTSALGASGAVFGIIGTLTLIKPLMTVWAFSLPMPLFLASLLWAAGDLLGIFMPSNIANLAHLSGLALGLIFGLVFRLTKKKKPHTQNYKIELPEREVRIWEEQYLK
jgi:hypothetical protein